MWDNLEIMAKKTAFQKGVEFIKKQTKKKGGKRRQPGLLGKAGAIFIGLIPLGVPVPGLVSQAQVRDKVGVSTGSNVEASFKGYINGLANGIGLGDVFETMSFNNKDGSLRGVAEVGNGNTPRGSTWTIWAVGFSYMLMDKLAQVINSNKGQNIPMTRTRLIGSG